MSRGPEKVYFGPLLAGELNRIQRKHPSFLQSASFEAMVELIVLKAENGQGEKLFTLEDKPILMREQVEVISRVAAELMSGTSSEELEKTKERSAKVQFDYLGGSPWQNHRGD